MSKGLLAENEEDEKQKHRDILTNENNESMNQLVSEKDAAYKRFSDNEIISVDDEFLHDFALGKDQLQSGEKTKQFWDAPTPTPIPSPVFFNVSENEKEEEQKEEKGEESEKKSVSGVSYAMQVDMDDLILPDFQEKD